MCRLLGLIANKPVDLRFSLFEGNHTLHEMSNRNPDGWGLGWYEEGGQAHVFKEPLSASQSQSFRSTAHQISRVFVAHVRRGTQGNNVLENTHPFLHGVYLFAHNGTVNEHEALRAKLSTEHRNALAGKTDSEVLFHWILQSIEGADGQVLAGVKTAVEHIHDYSALNFLLSDGHKLYAYRDAKESPSYYSLFYLERTRHEGTYQSLVRQTSVKALLESKALKSEEAVLVCSERLTQEHWREVPNGYLLEVNEALQVALHPVR